MSAKGELSLPSEALSPDAFSAYLEECRTLVLDELARYVPARRPRDVPFYDLMREYPLRKAKALRPALCIAVCRALGGAMEAVLPTAAAIELYHNAFLVHDDVEDGSLFRRDEPTLHRKYGVPIAVNVGDGMLALALEPLLENTRVLGLGRALRILRVVARMARESAEGQAMELCWVRENKWDLDDADYIRMVHKKTSYYSFITPMLVGGIAAGAREGTLRSLFILGARMGAAFQIQDDVLNLVADERAYGKEIAGDLWEGKHTLILLHMMRAASEADREEARQILRKERPQEEAPALGGSVKTEEDVQRLLQWIHAYGSLEYSQAIAARRALAAKTTLMALAPQMGRSVHRSLLFTLVHFITERDH